MRGADELRNVGSQVVGDIDGVETYGSTCLVRAARSDTKNGYGRLVVMDIDYYEKTMRKMYEAKTILEGLEDAKFGNTVDGDTAISNVRSKYGI